MRFINFWEKLFVIIAIFFVSNAFRDIIPYYTMFRFGYYFLLLIAVFIYLEEILRIFPKAPFMTAIILFAMLSVMWSDFRGSTLSRSFVLMMTMLFAYYFAARFTLREQLYLLALTVFLMIVASVIVVFVMPTYGIDGGWRGVFTQKNVFGRILGIGALLALTYPTRGKWRKLLKIISYFTCIGLIFPASSFTALIGALGATLMYFVYKIFRMRTIPGLAVASAIAVPLGSLFYLVVNIDFDAILISLGKDPTLTGRTVVWDKIQSAIDLRPALGYGYGAFFKQWDGIYGTLWSRNADWSPGTAHHSFLDVWVQLGVIGLAILVVALVFLYLGALRYVRITSGSDGMWPLTFITFILLMSFSESFFLLNDIYWALIVVYAYSLGRSPVKIETKAYNHQRSDLYSLTKMAGKTAAG